MKAVDLALRLALVATGHRDVVTVREAYRGLRTVNQATAIATR
jgi:4-aminobutyrate aminotransferase-like enzyme